MSRGPIERRKLLGAGVVAVALGVGVSHAFAGARPGTDPVPPAPAPAALATVSGAYPSVSDDGRYIVYEGQPTDGSTRQRTIFLRDMGAPQVDGKPAPDIELTVPAPDVRPGESVRPAISGDGCVVAVVTQMGYDLFRDDDSGNRWDVYAEVLPQCDGGKLGDWQLVSSEASADGDVHALDRVVPDEAPAVSESGSVVAYTHNGRSNKDSVLAVDVVDMTKPIGTDGRTMRVAGTPLLPPNTTFLYHGQREPDVSDDGRFVTFTSDAVSTDAVPDWGGGPVPGDYATSQVYLWDRESLDPTAAVVLVSTVDGHPAKTGAGAPAISGNGQYVAFESSSPDLGGSASLPECTNTCPSQIYRYDQLAEQSVLVSRENTAEGRTWVAADHGATQATINDDGTQVGFVTRSRNLFPTMAEAGGEPGDGEIVVSEVDRGVIRRVSTLSDGLTPAPSVNAHPDLTGPGHFIVFDTLAAPAYTGLDLTGRQVVSVSRAPQLSVPTLDVGTVALNYPGPEWYVGIRNEGPSTFVPATVEMSNPDFQVTGGTCTLGLPVPPGQSCEVHLVLTPTLIDVITSDLTVSESIFGGTSVTSQVRGAGGEPALRNSAGKGDYPSTAVGQKSEPISYEIANIGFVPTTIARIMLMGDNPKDFKVTDSSCKGYLLNPGATCSIDAIFAPTEPGYRSATMIVQTDLGQYTSIVMVGDATRVATLQVSEAKIRAGDDIGLGGSGFKPDSLVNISWADGRGQSITVTTNHDGSFLATLPTRPSERLGDRVVVAQSLDAVARVDVEVTRRPGRSGSPLGG